MKVKLIDIPIYFGYLRIVIAKDYVKVAKKLKVDDEGFDLNSLGAFVSTSKDERGVSYYNLFIHKDIHHDLLAHEVVHLVNSVFVERRIKLDPHNDEAQAYLTGWITNEIYKVINRINNSL